MEKIRVIQCRRGHHPIIAEIPAGLEPQQKFVGGYIEHLNLAPQVDLVCNEEGLLIGLPLHRLIRLEDRGEHCLHGDLLIVAHDNDGSARSLTESEAIEWRQWLSDQPVAMRAIPAGKDPGVAA